MSELMCMAHVLLFQEDFFLALWAACSEYKMWNTSACSLSKAEWFTSNYSSVLQLWAVSEQRTAFCDEDKVYLGWRTEKTAEFSCLLYMPCIRHVHYCFTHVKQLITAVVSTNSCLRDKISCLFGMKILFKDLNESILFTRLIHALWITN